MKHLIEITGDGYAISATPEAAQLKARLLADSASIKQVKNDAGLALARPVLSEIASFRKELEATRKVVKEPVLAVGRRIDRLAEEFGKEINAEESRIKKLIGDYAMEQERKRREIEAEAERLRMEAEEKEQQAEIARLKASTLSQAKADKLEAEAERKIDKAADLSIVAAQAKVSGASVVLDFEVENIAALAAEFPDLVKMEAKRREILERLKLMFDRGLKPELPGIRVFETSRVRAA